MIRCRGCSTCRQQQRWHDGWGTLSHLLMVLLFLPFHLQEILPHPQKGVFIHLHVECSLWHNFDGCHKQAI